MKKLILTLGIIIAVVMTGISTVQAATASATLNSTSTTVKPDDTFTVTLALTTDQAFETIGGDQNSGRYDDSFALNYDTSKLELVNQEVVAANVMDMGIDTDENTGEEARTTDKVLLLALSGIRTGDLYKWTFKVKTDAESGNTQISTTSIIGTDFSDEETTITTNPITITIAATSTGSENNNSGESTGEDSSNTEEKSSGQENNNGGSTSSSSGNDSEKSIKESTTGQSGDSTTAASAGKIIPAAGSIAIKSLLIAGIATIGIVAYRRFNQLKDVK